MGFYLRKSFSKGPIRLNLSKSGLGVSGGIKGARVGMGSRGAYVHGGRHGLYYRKSISSTKGNRNSQNQNTGDQTLYVNTGYSYSKKQDNTSNFKSTFPEPKNWNTIKHSSNSIWFLSAIFTFQSCHLCWIYNYFNRYLYNHQQKKKRQETYKTIP
jgi:hypothetical protein